VSDTEPDGTDARREDGDATARGGAPVTQQVGRVAIVVVAVLFLVFALANAHHVDFSWLIGETEVVQRAGERVSGGVPLIVLLMAAFAAGALVATLIGWQRHRHRG
jgi:uncharacterized integral membrane protein